jgi:hypothetical protein
LGNNILLSIDDEMAKRSPCRKAAILGISIVATVALIQVFRNSLNISNCYNDTNNIEQQQQRLQTGSHSHFGSNESLQEADNYYLTNNNLNSIKETTSPAADQQQHYKQYNLTFSIEQNKHPPKLLHVIWGRPLPSIDKTFNSKTRIFDNSSYTGCCDQLVELALKSYVKNLPGGYTIYLWNIGGWDSIGFLRSIGLHNDAEEGATSSSSSSSHTVVKPMEFDPKIEMIEEPELIHIYEQVQAVVPRGDFVRYYVMKKHGGSYVDLDGILVRSIPYQDGVPMMNLSPTAQNTAKDLQTCAGRGYFRQPHTCILSNGLFVGFPANHVVFHIIIDTIQKEKRTCGGKSYFCYGPEWMTRALLNAGIGNMADLGIVVGPFLRNNGEYKRHNEVFIAHLGLGHGDSKLVGDSLCQASAVHSELCQKFNVTERSRDTSRTTLNITSGVTGRSRDESSALVNNKSLDNKSAYSKPQTHSGYKTLNSVSDYISNSKIAFNNSQASNELFTNPSLFESKTQRLTCDTSQQMSWEMAVASRYDKLNGKCISPSKDLDHYGPSGPGSSLKSTASLRKMLDEFFYTHDIKTFLDAPCGDWLWMQTVNLTGLQYFGGDITNVTVQTNQRCFGSDNIHFHWFDLTCMIPPAVDLILVRDVLFQMPEDHVHKVLTNINQSGAKYLATTTFSSGSNGNFKVSAAYPETRSKRVGNDLIGFQRLNLYAHPFNFPPPLMKAEESVPGRQVGIRKLPLDNILDNKS